MPLPITSDAFGNGQAIARKYTGDGEDISPPMHWSGVPEAARSVSLIVDDTDAPHGRFVHWLIYNIPAEISDLPEGVSSKASQFAAAAMEGQNSFETIGYRGPAPPRGHGRHHYHFHLYAPDQPLQVKPGLDKQALLAAMAGHILDEGEIVATYERP